MAILAASLVLASAPAGAFEGDLPEKGASVDGEVHEVAYHGDTLYAGGSFGAARDGDGTAHPRGNLAAVNAATGALEDFAPDVDGTVYAVAVEGDWLYIGGAFRKVDGAYLPNLARFDLATGQADRSFSPRPSATVYSLETHGETLYLGGHFASVGDFQQHGLAAVRTSDGTPVEEFAPRVGRGSVRDIEVANGRVYFAGGFLGVDGAESYAALAAVDPADGSLFMDFRAGMFVLIRQIAVDGDRVYGALDGRGGEVRAFDARTGSTRWSVPVDGGVQAVTVYNGLVIGGGHFDRVCNSSQSGPNGECVDGVKERRGKLFAVDTDGRVLDWNPGANTPIGVNTLRTQPDGASFAAGGTFTAFGGGRMEQQGIAVFR